MKEIIYVIKDPSGIHARPAGMLVKEASKFESEIKINLNEKSADAKRIFAVMGLGAKSGDEVEFFIKGKDEEAAADHLMTFLKNNL